jgi:hypothetical protein
MDGAALSLMALPTTLFNASKETDKWNVGFNQKEKEELNNRNYQNEWDEIFSVKYACNRPGGLGPVFYALFQSDKQKRVKSKDELRTVWNRADWLKMNSLVLANWMVWTHFGLWYIMPNDNLKAAFSRTYEDINNIILNVNEHDYTLNFDINEVDPAFMQTVENAREYLNSQVKDAKAKITFGEKFLTENGVGIASIHVPLNEIVLDLLWQDYSGE